MKRRHFIPITTLTTAAAFVTGSAFAEQDGKIGMTAADEWQKLNRQAGAKLKAIQPTTDKLSEADLALMLKVAMGGMMQLAISEAALTKATSADVKMYAQAEVEEQTTLAAKLKEITKAKGMMLPAEVDEKTTKMIAKLNAKSGAEFDKMYLQEGGVDGHQRLENIMKEVQSHAADTTLKAVATTALPLIMAHLQAAREEMKAAG